MGCGTGQCGSGTVVIDGKAVTSCTVRRRESRAGTNVLTTRVLRRRAASSHPIPAGFVEAGAIQSAAFARPGIVMASTRSSLKTGRDDETIMNALDKHLCRCTGYEHSAGGAASRREAPRGAQTEAVEDALAPDRALSGKENERRMNSWHSVF